MFALVIGLGNIGEAYEGTRHNVGFEVLDRVARKLAATRQPDRRYARRAFGRVGSGVIELIWPTTLMNRSGLAVREAMDRLEAAPSEMLVVVDDYNLNLGALRFRPGGSDGGHNGLASIATELGSEQFARLRLGIGPAPDEIERSEFVLRRFAADEIETKDKMISDASEAVVYVLSHRLEDAMTVYNRNPARS